MINLITSFYRPDNQERVDELVKCLHMNIRCSHIKKIYLFTENNEDIEYIKSKIDSPKNKIQLILWNKQPTYRDYLDLANGLRGQLCMISNADIWLKQCDSALLSIIGRGVNIAYSLTRHEYNGETPMIDGFRPNMMSYDSFIFRSPIYVNDGIDHIQNRPGSEHVFKYMLERSGAYFFNPCNDIVIIHEHKSGYRTYTQKDDLLKAEDVSGNWRWTFPRLTYTPPTNKQWVLDKYRNKKHRVPKYSLFSMKKNRKKTYTTI